MAESVLKNIPIARIKENPDALRPVNRTTEKYLELVTSIRDHGIINPISVREIKSENGEELYGLVDGLHRFTGARDAGLTTVPCNVLSLTDGEVLEAQIIGNIQKIETKPVEYSKQILRIASSNPLLTVNALAAKLCKSPKWLQDRLALPNLNDDIAKLVDDDKIPLMSAYSLAKLSKEDQPNFVERAMTVKPELFVPMVSARVKEIRDAARQGRETKPDEFEATPYIRKASELKEELENKQYATALNVPDVSSFQMGIKFALHLDPLSIDKDKQEWEASKKKREADKAAREREKLQKKQKEAEDTQNQVVEKLKNMGATAAV